MANLMALEAAQLEWSEGHGCMSEYGRGCKKTKIFKGICWPFFGGNLSRSTMRIKPKRCLAFDLLTQRENDATMEVRCASWVYMEMWMGARGDNVPVQELAK